MTGEMAFLCFAAFALSMLVVGAVLVAQASARQRGQHSDAAALRDEWEEQAARKKRGNEILEVTWLGSGETRCKSGSMARAVLAGALFGQVGAVLGSVAAVHGEAPMQRFAVRYGDGRVEIKEVHPKSREYQTLIKYVKTDGPAAPQ